MKMIHRGTATREGLFREDVPRSAPGLDELEIPSGLTESEQVSVIGSVNQCGPSKRSHRDT